MGVETCCHRLATGATGERRRMDNSSHAEIGVFLGVDVGKGAHHAVALDRVGERLLDRALPNDESQLRGLINGLRAYGPGVASGGSAGDGRRPGRRRCPR